MHSTYSNRKLNCYHVASFSDGLNRPLRTRPIKKEIDHDEKNRVYTKLLEMALGKKNQDLSFIDNVRDAPNESNIKGYREEPLSLRKKDENCSASLDNLYTIVQVNDWRIKIF